MNSIRCFLCLAVLALCLGLGGTTRANDVYIAQTAAGANTGADCADALVYTYFNTASNWTSGTPSGTKIGPGTTVHLCGTITSQIKGQGSGSASSPITIVFAPGAAVIVPVCPPGGCMVFNGLSYIVVDGGSSVACGHVNGSDVHCNNGGIQNTANGTGLANQSPSQGIYATPCNNCEFKNLLVANLYVHTAVGDSAVDQTSVRCITVTGSNTSVHNNTMHDAGWCLIDSYAQGDADVAFYNNEVYNIDHGYVLSGATYTGSSGPFLFHDNHIHDFANWDVTSNDYHHDGIHCFSSNSGGNPINGIYIYNNVFDGQLGVGINSDIYIEGSTGPPCASVTTPIYLFNNVLAISHYSTAGHMGLFSGKDAAYSNTLISTDNNSNGTCWTTSGAYGGIGVQTEENNIIAGCFILQSYTPGSWALGGLGHNVYGSPVNTASDFWCQGQISFANWLACVGNPPNTVLMSAVGVSTSTGMPTAGSPVLGAGANLTSLCTGDLAPLCMDIAGNSRPASGAWDAGAYQISSSQPAPPQDLTATSN